MKTQRSCKIGLKEKKVRDSNCEEEYMQAVFKVEIPHLKKIIDEIPQLEEDERNGIQRYPRNNVDIIYRKKKTITVSLRDLLDVQYSSDSIAINYEELFDLFIKYSADVELKHIGYIVFLRFFSLGIMLELDKERMRPLVDKLDRDNVDDILLSYLSEAYGIKRRFKSTSFYRESPYSNAARICEAAMKDKEKAKVMLKEYMENFLIAHSDMEWEKAAETWASYKGLWSYEAAAIAKLFGIDDSDLKDYPNYPYDLAHYKDGDIKAEKIHILDRSVEEDVKLINSYKTGIPHNTDAESIIAPMYHERVNELIDDYQSLTAEELWKKYKLQDVWFTCDEYIEEKGDSQILGMLIVFLLTDLGYILQIDYKEDFEDYKDQLKNCWDSGKKTKIIQFELDNDQQYYALIPEENKVTDLYEAGVKVII